ncbi:MAG: branched-chain amino acid aminotransferase [Planctomycetaceae bacterium]|nr:branched-chain amino acid aminotransferase [Planctomycetaceae bacterium]
MIHLFEALRADEAGFVVSAEMVLVGTIAVLAMIVGLAEMSHNVNQELEDAATALGRINQSYVYYGLRGHMAAVAGSWFHDNVDFCDGEFDIVGTHPRSENKYGNGHGY